MNKTYLFLSLAIFLAACTSNSKPSDTGETSDAISVQFLCESISGDETMPRSALYALIGEARVKIGELSSCEQIAGADYADYQVPAEALAAAGGWWAGGGDYFYAIRKSEDIQIMKAEVDEMQEGPAYPYKLAAVFSKGKLSINLSATDLVGLYTQGGHDMSWILFLGMQGNKLEARLFEVDGMLPPQAELLQYLPEMESQVLEQFEVDIEKRTFSSERGAGKFEMGPDGLEVTFSDLEDQSGEVLRMNKVE